MLHKLIRNIAPVAAIFLAGATAGCSDVNIRINGEEGVPLSELDMSGDPPSALVLASPDEVIVSNGSALSIDVSGDEDAIERLRFTLDGDTLGIGREDGSWEGSGKAVINVTMPAPNEVTLAGSGGAKLEEMTGPAEITIAGSGALEVAKLEAEKAEVTLAGSGAAKAAGAVEKLELTVAGSGSLAAEGLKAESAEITIAGSGEASFASDGKVEGNIIGSGTVRVIGRATCEVSALGSGSLICEPASDGDTSDQAEAKSAKKEAKKSAKKKVAKKKSSPKKGKRA